jgi:hypothetical protein
MLRIDSTVLEVIRGLRPVVASIEMHDRDLARQLRRAMASVALNIQEGSGSNGGTRRERYRKALGSARERVSTSRWRSDTSRSLTRRCSTRSTRSARRSSRSCSEALWRAKTSARWLVLARPSAGPSPVEGSRVVDARGRHLDGAARPRVWSRVKPVPYTSDAPTRRISSTEHLATSATRNTVPMPGGRCPAQRRSAELDGVLLLPHWLACRPA